MDVYSYGVVLMEIITGRKILDDSRSDDDKFLIPTFTTAVMDKEKLRNIGVMDKFLIPHSGGLELNGED
jgi:hypothetical protein